MIVFAPVPLAVEKAASECVDCGIHVHRALGPGFKEKIYHRAYCLELDSRGIKFECEKPIVVGYKNWEIPGQKVDLIVEGVLVSLVPSRQRVPVAVAVSGTSPGPIPLPSHRASRRGWTDPAPRTRLRAQ
jgi:hypothetical protein